MYPKNAASPERIAVGPVVLIADGTVQTSGVSITVVPQGGTTAAGGGTTSYEQGVVFYLPTQAETNYTSFIVTAYKASCIPAAATVVTSASATAGKVVLSGETHTSAVIPTVTTLTGHTAQTGDSFARLGAPAGASISADIAAIEAQTDDIGLAGAGLTALASASDLATVAGYLDTEIAAIKAKTDNLPAAPAATGDIPTAAAVADAVWDEAISGHLAAGTTGSALNAAGSAGDPWATAIPGAYGAGTAGKILGDNINATISSRASQTSLDTVDDLLDTEVAAIKADTAAILTDTAEIGVAGAGLTAINLPDQTMNITGNLSGSVGSVTGAVGSVTAGVTVATGGIGSGAHAAAELNAIADATLDRNMATGVDSGTNSTSVRTPRQALRALRNKVSVAAGTATVTKEDDTTTSWTSAIATTAGDPISSSDPT